MTRGADDANAGGVSEKARLRERLRRARAALPASYRAAADEAITASLVALPEYASARVVFCYIGVGDETDTAAFMARARGDGKRVCAPRIVGDGVMEARAFTERADLEAAAFGLLEPNARCPRVSPDEIDLAVIPCLACDRFGGRIGYGGGYYDRYMAHTRFFKAALCRERAFFHDALPGEPHDRLVDAVVSESSVYRIRPPVRRSFPARYP